MKSLVLFDSYFGNTQKIAEVIAKELGETSRAIRVSDFDKKDLENIDLLVLGSPIRGWQPSEGTNALLNSMGKDELVGVKATTFDTRVKLFIHGDAKDKMAKILAAAGAEIITEPMPFYVAGPQQDPHLLDGEIEKAKNWAKLIKDKI